MMNKESPFSAEYDIGNSTELTTSTQENIPASIGQVANDFIEKMESYYKLSKPSRNVIRARIIP